MLMNDKKKIFGIGIVVGIVLHSLITRLCGKSYEKESDDYWLYITGFDSIDCNL